MKTWMRWMRLVFIGWVLVGAVGDAAASEGERARLMELRREIARHDELYFRKGAPEISDFEYDELKRELRGLEAKFAEEDGVAEAEATGVSGVGDDRTGSFAAWRHGVAMLSLDKAHTDEELGAFHARAAARLGSEEVVYRVEPKYDGLAVSITYERGRLARVVTRGNGEEGDDVTASARALVRALPATLAGDAASWPERIEVRGEIFMTWAEFARINAEREAAGEVVFANPRNLAVGTLRTRDPADATGRRLELVCFGWGAWEQGGGRNEISDTLNAFAGVLEAWGLPVAEAGWVATGREKMLAAVAVVNTEGARRGFPTDGVVVKLERVADQTALGVGRTAPRWAVARKFEPERAATRLVGITWQVGRTGVVTPVAELEPVELAGSTVARATLHNADEIARRDLRVGDVVWVAKAGEIIPAIIGVDKARRTGAEAVYVFPDTCPACTETLAREEGRAAWRCANAVCPAQVARRIEHWASAGALDIGGLGPALIARLVEGGLAGGPADLYRLRAEDLRGLPGVGERTALKLIEEIAASRERARADGARLVAGLGLPGVGRETARRLAGAFDGLAVLAAADEAGLSAAGLGEATARGVAEHLARAEVRAELAALQVAGLGEAWRNGEAGGGALVGQTVVVTGRLKQWTRKQVEERLRAAGARVMSGVSQETTLVVAGEDPGSTLERARGRGVEVIDETELARRFNTP
jgi:DNA ligase (NAD+)